MESGLPLERVLVTAAHLGPLRPGFERHAGQIRKILGPGEYIAVMAGSGDIRVRGPENLSVGSKVQVAFSEWTVGRKNPKIEGSGTPAAVSGDFQWLARLPLGFGGKGAEARIEVFVEKQPKGFLKKNSPVSYLVFTVETEKQGEIQWSIYLKGRQVAFQVYAGPHGSPAGPLKAMMKGIEESLERKGYSLMAPTLFLKKPFKIPAGFRLNVKG